MCSHEMKFSWILERDLCGLREHLGKPGNQTLDSGMLVHQYPQGRGELRVVGFLHAFALYPRDGYRLSRKNDLDNSAHETLFRCSDKIVDRNDIFFFDSKET